MTCAPDPAALYLARLGTDHSRRTATAALSTVARLLDVNTINWGRRHLRRTGHRPCRAGRVLGGVGQHGLDDGPQVIGEGACSAQIQQYDLRVRQVPCKLRSSDRSLQAQSFAR